MLRGFDTPTCVHYGFFYGPEPGQGSPGAAQTEDRHPMHYRDSAYLVRQFTGGVKTQFLKGDTLVISKDSLPAALEIHVLQHDNMGVMDQIFSVAVGLRSVSPILRTSLTKWPLGRASYS